MPGVFSKPGDASRRGARTRRSTFSVQGFKVEPTNCCTIRFRTLNFELKTTEGRFLTCGCAADGKAAQELMLGRTLTVSRARELNAKDYFYQMLNDNPPKLMWLDD